MLLKRQKLIERSLAIFFILGKNHLAHRGDSIALEEHMFGSAKSYALRAKITRTLSILRGIGVGADAKRAKLVRPLHDRLKLA